MDSIRGDSHPFDTGPAKHSSGHAGSDSRFEIPDRMSAQHLPSYIERPPDAAGVFAIYPENGIPPKCFPVELAESPPESMHVIWSRVTACHAHSATIRWKHLAARLFLSTVCILPSRKEKLLLISNKENAP